MTMTASQALRAPRTPDGSARAAAFFDLDGTLIPGSATLPLTRAAFRAGVVAPPELARDLRNGLSLLLQGATDEHCAAVRDRILSAVRDRSAPELVALSDRFTDELVASITPAMRRVLEEHGAAGRDRVVLSASPTEIVSRLADAAGLEQGVGTRPGRDTDGRGTGRLEGLSRCPEGKAEILRALAEEHGYDLSASYAYADSISDLPLLEAVGHPVAVNPDPKLRDLAEVRGWPIVETSRIPRVSLSDPHSWVRMGQRLTVASVGSLIALGTRPIEALGGIDGDPGDDAPTGDRPASSAATAA
jgi:HAD superfamily hydrolase (TIGR01490 family)